MLRKSIFILLLMSFLMLLGCIVSGRVEKDGVGLEGVELHLEGPISQVLTTNEERDFSFIIPESGYYTITPYKENYTFEPESIDFNMMMLYNINGANFEAY